MLWSAAILLALGFVWFVEGIAVPAWRMRREVEVCSWGSGENIWDFSPRQYGGPDRAIRSLHIYLVMPAKLAPHKDVARRMLCMCGPAAIPDMIRMTRHSDPWVRKRAIYALQKFNDPRSVEPLCALLTDKDCVDAAAMALEDVADVRAIPSLIKAMSNTCQITHNAIVRSLVRVGAPAVPNLLEALNSDDCCVREGAVALKEIGDQRALGPLVHALHNDPVVHRTAAEALAVFGEQGLDALLAATQVDRRGHGRDTVESAIKGLGLTRNPRAVEPLIAMLKDEDGGMVEAAADSLGRLGDRRAVEPLLCVLQEDVWWLQREAACALGYIGDRRAEEPLKALLKKLDLTKDCNRMVQEVALSSLKQIAKDSSVAAPGEGRDGQRNNPE